MVAFRSHFVEGFQISPLMGRICEDDLLTNVSVSRILDHQLSKNYQSHLRSVQNICVETGWFELHSGTTVSRISRLNILMMFTFQVAAFLLK